MSLEFQDVIDQLSLRGKCTATLMDGLRISALPEVGNPGMLICDNTRGNEDYNVETPEERAAVLHPVAYPQASAQAAGWDDSISYEIGNAMGTEAKRKGIQVLLRPAVNIKRSPLCGRNFEYYSEDPLLAGRLGAAFIRGTQDAGTAACLKHYCVNSQEFERMTTNAVISERALREIYLKVFEIAIREGDPWSLMTSYNKVNGQWVPASPMLMNILRRDFQFDGAVLSDALAVHTEKIASHRCGMDFELNGPGVHDLELMDAINSGVLPESNLDEHLNRLLTLQKKVSQAPVDYAADFETEHARAREMAAQTMVLLKNDGILPLSEDNGFSPDQRIAVIGKLAAEPAYMGCGSGHMNGYRVDIPLEELEKHLGKLSYADAYELRNYPYTPYAANRALVEQAAETAAAADLVLFFAGLPTGYESEGYDRPDLQLPGDMKEALEAVLATGKRVILIHTSGSPVDLSAYADRVSAVLHSYHTGEAMGGAICDVLLGYAEPGGRLPETWPMRLEDTPSFLSFPNYPTVMENVVYGEDIFVGYRWYEKRKLPVLYPFGHGLSYTTFSYGTASCDQTYYKETDTIRITVPVSNTGSRVGSQVLQVYMSKTAGGFQTPVKELKGYAKLTIAPGQSQDAVIEIKVADLGTFDEKQHKFVREPGEWLVQLGESSASILQTISITLEGNRAAKVYDNLTAIEWYKKDPRTAAFTADKEEALQKILADHGADDALLAAAPIYRHTEPMFGHPAALTPEMLAQLKAALNE